VRAHGSCYTVGGSGIEKEPQLLWCAEQGGEAFAAGQPTAATVVVQAQPDGSAVPDRSSLLALSC